MGSVDGRLTYERRTSPDKAERMFMVAAPEADMHFTSYTSNDPSTYMIIGEDDAIASPSTIRRRVENLEMLSIEAKFHLFSNLHPGFGLGTGTSTEGWEKDAVKFWENTFSVKMVLLTENNIKEDHPLLYTFTR